MNRKITDFFGDVLYDRVQSCRYNIRKKNKTNYNTYSKISEDTPEFYIEGSKENTKETIKNRTNENIKEDVSYDNNKNAVIPYGSKNGGVIAVNNKKIGGRAQRTSDII